MRPLFFGFAIVGAVACAQDLDVEDGEGDRFGSGKADGGVEEGSPEARGVLALVNDGEVGVEELDVAAGLSSRAARNIIEYRDGGERFDDLAELDAIPYVGPATLEQLVGYARETGRVVALPRVEVVFSPQPAASAHTRRVAQLIRGAEATVDIAMYSLSDADVSAAIAEAAERGVRVRVLFETANDDRKLDAAARPGSKSGRLERAGADVRWVNKILHHKSAIVDGASLVTGSANWSYGGAQIYDENTLFIEDAPELAAAFAREFERLWAHSADFALDEPAPPPPLADVPPADDDPDAAALFTSANFTVLPGSTTFRIVRTSTAVADQLVAAIERAERSIWIASGHLRLRPVAEALIARRQARPDLDIRVYLDQQEYISAAGDAAQVRDAERCLERATTDTQRWSCTHRALLFGKQVGDAGIDVRYKTYAYRWDYSYALQMHHKFIVIDRAELFTGSYNLSINAEQSTFENVVHLRGATYAPVVAAFVAEFERLWDTGRAPDLLPALRATISTAPTIPLVFDSMALTWDEVTDLRALTRTHCPAVDSAAFRDDPAAHRTCSR